MKRILSEKNLVVVLFVMVLVIFSLAQEDTKKIEKMYQDANSPVTSSLDEIQNTDASKQKTSNMIPAVKTR
ncbi:MAG TPA: hypothetical protein VIZ28_00900 [Chitinophagaceae bacterium]